jgi:ribonuclease D
MEYVHAADSDAIRSPIVVDTPDALEALDQVLMAQPRVAVDTEANSLYAYQEQVCLIQVSVPGANYLVDPLALDDLSPLAPFFEAPEIEKVFHAADYDLMVLLRDFGFATQGIFDTMWAARVLGWPKVGLADILATHFGVEVNKRYQRYDWGRRPLDPEALRYAWMDSYYLLPLREIQKAELEETGRWEEAQEIFDYLTSTVTVPPEHDGRFFWRIKGIHALRDYDQRVLYQLYLWREEMAAALDRPPVKIMANHRLVRIAKMQPRTRQELAAAGLTPGQIRRFGSGLLKVLRRDPPAELPDPPQHERPSDAALDRFQALKAWRKDVAHVRGVDSDVILPNAALWQLAEHPPHNLDELLDVPGIGPWRQSAYGPDLLELVAVKGS